MSATDTERDTPRREGAQFALAVAAGAKINAGALVAKNASGYAVPASDTAGLVVMGRAEASADNTDGQAGDLTVEVRSGCFAYDCTGATIADIGKPAYVSDDQTVAKSGTEHGIFAGIIADVPEADTVFIQVSPFLADTAPLADALDELDTTVGGHTTAIGTLEGRVAANAAAITQADAGTQGAEYSQSAVQAIADLANANKAKVNAILAALKAAGLMAADT